MTGSIGMQTPWTWRDGTPEERGNVVRAHFMRNKVDMPELCELFCLTERGAEQIIRGNVWRPDYSIDGQILSWFEARKAVTG